MKPLQLNVMHFLVCQIYIEIHFSERIPSSQRNFGFFNKSGKLWKIMVQYPQ